MPVRVPFHLLRHDRPEACAGLLLFSANIDELLRVCGHLGADPLPPIFPVEGGFLILRDEPPFVPAAHMLRLRRLAENGYLPLDADLTPELLPDEAAVLTRQRGLVFLPPDRCLAFDPRFTLEAGALIGFPAVKRSDWRPFPEGPSRPHSLTTITRVVPDLTPESILDAGGADIGTETPRPPAVGPVKTAIGRAQLGIGKGLAGMGVLLGIGALARAGAAMIGAALAAVPRLSESVLGKQEAALRELLRKFREGRIEEALKNALPMGGTEPAGQLHTNEELPTHQLRWSLAGLFGSRGPASVWVGGAEVQRDLAAEYRKAAQAALAAGDCRRAAFIYAKLLNEIHTAADVLSQGGLHRDAAILFRDLLNRPHLAARAFEAAGEYDEALRLYRQAGDHEAAGDLLRRMGEAELALVEFHAAAQKVADDHQDYCQAGELILRKTGRADLAGAYFTLGWRERDRSPKFADNAIPCAIRLAEIHAFAEPLDSFWLHLDEVQLWLDRPGDTRGRVNFFNKVMTLADLPHLARHRAELRDRCRMALADTLRRHSQIEQRPGSIVSDLFGHSGLWSAAVVSDAQIALREELRQARPKESRPNQISAIAYGTVSAVAFAHQSGDIVIGLTNGHISMFHPATRKTTLVAAGSSNPVEALAVDPLGTVVVSAGKKDDAPNLVRLLSYRRRETGEFRFQTMRSHDLLESDWYHLNPIIQKLGPQTSVTLLSTENGLITFRVALLLQQAVPSMFAEAPILLCLEGQQGSLIKLTNHRLHWSDNVKFEMQSFPSIPEHSSLRHVPIQWLRVSEEVLEIAMIDRFGVIHWSSFEAPTDMTPQGQQRTISASHAKYTAVTIWKSGLLIGVTEANRLYWLRVSGREVKDWFPPTDLAIPTRTVACFPSHATREVIVILANGESVRVPVPA